MRIVFLALAFGLGVSGALADVSPRAESRAGVLTADEAVIAKKAEQDKAMADCQRHWDAGTHMTRSAWARTCQRLQDRFRQLDLR